MSDNTGSKIVTETEALRIFREIAAIKSIPFDFYDDCCYSRAHKMCQILRSKGITPRKIWNYSSGWPRATLRIAMPGQADEYIYWNYHVAPIITVETSKDTLSSRVIDPSLFDRPVTEDQWKDAQNDQDSLIITTGYAYYYQDPNGITEQFDNDYSQTERELKKHRDERDLRDLR